RYSTTSATSWLISAPPVSTSWEPAGPVNSTLAGGGNGPVSPATWKMTRCRSRLAGTFGVATNSPFTESSDPTATSWWNVMNDTGVVGAASQPVMSQVSPEADRPLRVTSSVAP